MLYTQPQFGPNQVKGEWIAQGLVSSTLFVNRETDTHGKLNLTRAGTGHTRVVSNQGLGISQAAGSNFWTSAGQNTVIGGGNAFTVVLTFTLNTTGQTSKYLLAERIEGDVSGAQQSAVIYGFVANTVEFFAQGFTGTDPRTTSQIVVNDTLVHTVVYSYDGQRWRGYLDGRKVFDVARTFNLFNSTAGRVGSANAAGSSIPDATFLHHARFSKGVSDSMGASLSGNPWQIYFDEEEEEDAYLFQPTGSVQSVTITPTGGLVMSGVVLKTVGATRTPSGGIIFSGEGGRSYGVVRTPVGGLSLSGVAGYNTGGFNTRSVVPSGGVVLSGQALMRQATSRTLSGGIVFSGQAALRYNTGAYVYLEGAYNDVWAGKLKLNGGVGALNDMINENTYWRGLVGGSAKPLNDVKRDVLGAGQLNDVEKEYWKSL